MLASVASGEWCGKLFFGDDLQWLVSVGLALVHADRHVVVTSNA